MATPTHVLVPLDGSPLAEDALAHALTVHGAPTTVLNVVTPVEASMSESGVIDPDDERVREAGDRADRVVASVVETLDVEPGPVETVVEVGEPAETIIEYVRTHEVDIVVMGGHGGDRRGVTERLLGTTATTVVTEAPVTVTVVR